MATRRKRRRKQRPRRRALRPRDRVKGPPPIRNILTELYEGALEGRRAEYIDRNTRPRAARLALRLTIVKVAELAGISPLLVEQAETRRFYPGGVLGTVSEKTARAVLSVFNAELESLYWAVGLELGNSAELELIDLFQEFDEGRFIPIEGSATPRTHRSTVRRMLSEARFRQRYE